MCHKTRWLQKDRNDSLILEKVKQNDELILQNMIEKTLYQTHTAVAFWLGR